MENEVQSSQNQFVEVPVPVERPSNDAQNADLVMKQVPHQEPSQTNNVQVNTLATDMQHINLQQQQQSNPQQGFATNVSNVADTLTTNPVGQSLSTILQPEAFDQTVNGIQQCQKLIPTCTPASISFITQLQTKFATYSMERLSILQQIQFTNLLTELTTALENKQNELFNIPAVNQQQVAQQTPTNVQPILDVQMQPLYVRTSHLVEYRYLHQFISDMAQNMVKSASESLDAAATRQLNHYNDYSVRIDYHKHMNSPLRAIFSFQGASYVQRHQLKKSQCSYIQQRISPEGSKVNNNIINFPTFNTDFQFPWSIIFLSLDEKHIFKDFTEYHKKSQMDLPQNKDLHEFQVEAKFAYNQGSRWFRIHFDPQLNMDINERDAFCISNGFTPFQSTKRDRKYVRVFKPRDKNTAASDPEYIFIYGDDEQAFTKAYYRWVSTSPILKFGSFRVDILTSTALPKLPIDIPKPQHYEQIIPLHCAWANLSKTQLVSHLQAKFCPMLGFGGVYLPKFADSNHCVTGRLINMLPVFANTIDEDNLDKYFNWSITDGKWQPFTKPITNCPLFNQYTNILVPPLDVQEVALQNDMIFDGQRLDPITTPIYGSMHYWTMFNRDTPKTQISIQPSTIYSSFSSGFNPFKPLVEHDPMVQILFSPLDKLQESDKNLQFQNFITQQSSICAEIAQRYRRTQSISGFNSSFLHWNDFSPPGVFIKSRIPNQLEIFQMPMSTMSLNTFRTFNFANYTFVPKALISHIDEDTNQYYPHKRECIEAKYNKNNKRQNYNTQFYPAKKQNNYRK